MSWQKGKYTSFVNTGRGHCEGVDHVVDMGEHCLEVECRPVGPSAYDDYKYTLIPLWVVADVLKANGYEVIRK